MILNYINDNTQEFIKDKVFVFNTGNIIMKKHIIKNSNESENNKVIPPNVILTCQLLKLF